MSSKNGRFASPSTPGVSVVIPAYNSARFLPGAVASVRAQQWPKIEIIVVDDGSQDHTASVLEQLAGQDLRVIVQSNAGPGAARNTGIAAAQHEWVALLDADDIWLPGKLSAQFDAISKTPQTGFCYADATFEYSDGRTRYVRCRTHGRPLFVELLKGNFLHTSTMLIRRDCFNSTGVFDTTMRTGEDWDLWLRLAALHHSEPVRAPLIIYRSAPYIQRYRLKTLESCAILALDHLFSNADAVARWPLLENAKGRIYAWQYTVLAKSYLRHGHVVDFCRMATRAVQSHPIAIRFLLAHGMLKGSLL